MKGNKLIQGSPMTCVVQEIELIIIIISYGFISMNLKFYIHKMFLYNLKVRKSHLRVNVFVMICFLSFFFLLECALLTQDKYNEFARKKKKKVCG